MRRWLVAVMVMAALSPIFAQEDPYRDGARSQTTLRAMTVLGSWAIGNIAVSTPLFFLSEGQSRRFHEMNIAWNVVNLGIAGSALLGSREASPGDSFEQALNSQRQIESALLLNTGLDVAYIAAGWALLERSRRGLPDSERWAGYGASLIVQGGFLLVFDAIFYAVQRRNRPDLPVALP